MSKLSFRARALDASKPMPIYMAEELPDLPDYSAINRAVPQMPSGMEKEEECEHHLQRAICAGLIIPTPEVTDMPDREFYDKVYPANYKQPRQLIHMQPFSMEQDIPDYDMDSEDERWVDSQAGKLNLDPLKFEEMMDTLEKSSGQQVVTEQDARLLLKHSTGEITIAIFDYWLTKRLDVQKPLMPTVKTEQRAGTAANNPYLAFRRRTEKMQTRKNRKNDETSYEKMLKLRRDLNRAVTLLDLVKKRERMKRDHVDLTVEIFEKRFHARDFSGAIYAEASVIRTSRPAFTPIFHNHYTNQNWANKAILKEDVIPRKEKRQYKKRKHKSLAHSRNVGTSGMDYAAYSSDEESPVTSQFSPEPEETEDEGQFAFRRNKMCSYHRPLSVVGNWAWCSQEENGHADRRFRFTLTSLTHPKRHCIGFARRRMGRGGRIILDRMSTDNDDLWRTLDFTILEPNKKLLDRVATNASALIGDSGSVTRLISSSFNTNSNLRTEIKSEFSSNFIDNGNSASRTNVNDISDFSVKIKQEVEEEASRVDSEAAINIDESVKVIDAEQENGEILEILRSVQRDWLHFRPKTPPPDYEPPCHMLPLSDSYIVPSANPSSFSVELQSLDPPSTLLDTSSFLTDQFTFETMDSLDVPVTDTRQTPHSGDNKIVQTGINLNVNVGLNTLTPCGVDDSSVISSAKSEEEMTAMDKLMPCPDDPLNRTVMPGCSRFHVTDLGDKLEGSCTHKTIFSSTLASPKFNSVNAVSGDRPQSNIASTSATTMQQSTSTNSGNTNGLWSQFGHDGKMKNNKLPYAYSGGVGYSNASSGTLSLHTSAHTLTLNSHSANILEIPITDDSEPVSNKLGNTQCAETGTASTNNKPKTICRKNNLVMEVT